MELFLNLAGAFVAAAMVGLWLWSVPRGPKGFPDRRTQVVALALLILILFPVISVTDDLLAAENPAETDLLHRRDHEISGLHASLSSAACPETDVLALPPPVTWSRVAAWTTRLSLPKTPALWSISNRPPPPA